MYVVLIRNRRWYLGLRARGAAQHHRLAPSGRFQRHDDTTGDNGQDKTWGKMTMFDGKIVGKPLK